MNINFFWEKNGKISACRLHSTFVWRGLKRGIKITRQGLKEHEELLNQFLACLYSLNWMQLSCWIQIWKWKFEFRKFWKKSENLNLLSGLEIRVDRLETCERWTFETLVSKLQGKGWKTWRITEPILGLFVLIWMYFSSWIQMWEWTFEQKSLKKSWIRGERIKHMMSINRMSDSCT